MRVIYAFLIFAGILLLILPTAIPVIKTSSEFSLFNTKWNGCSEFARFLMTKGEVIPVMYSYNTIDLKSDGALIIVGPDVGFSQLEAEEIDKFLENGGVLLLADDFGTANSLLEKLAVKARFSSQPLEDIFYSKRSEFPVIIRIDRELAVGVDRVVLNIPASVTGGEGKAFSSKVSVGKSHTILAEVKRGNGKIILLSDPSVLMNDMFDENRKFIENLVDYLGVKRFYFDEAHHSDFNPYSITTVYVQKELDRGKAFNVFLLVFALAVLIESGIAGKILNSVVGILNRLLSRILKMEENIFEDLPDWVDRKVLEKMLNEIKTGSRFGDANERYRVHEKVEG
ncbi:hypothetical protein Asulf_01042 [Archaeoglobus sulfaticallidus PM70-1]|uniref:DUF4350 domain-containing protein n=1 Tax=Archaeoglobus sulfaticallidus PM70-1 TaxID=387631 RepID=N0BDH4_9EURY|nr:DUF4350 domain-containing protein [Archaeoglobus sulfaticallidus]AGK61043.1 hypothetical protein Asulf_01042 [Archaeoglobus sulfaticallidus PM70-1]